MLFKKLKLNVSENIGIIIPHKGLGDIIFHYPFIKSISNHHKKKIILFTNKSTKANFVYKNNKFIEKIVIIDLKRPNKFLYLLKIIEIFLQLYKYNLNVIYYTGNNYWHKISFKILNLFNPFKLENYKNNKKYIIKFLNFFLKKKKIKSNKVFDLIVDSKINKKFANNTKKFKKPWAFLSIDTSEDQVKIPEEILKKIIFKLKKKNKTIFINTNYENILKIKNYKKYKLTCTSKYNVSEIAYLIKNSKIFIGNESGPAAIASLYNKKSLLFFSKIVKIETKFMPNVNKRHYFKVEKISLKKNRFLNFI